MKYILTLLFLVVAYTSNAQIKEISLDEVSKHVGDSVHFMEKVTGVRQLVNSKGKPTFINLGEPYPNQTLTIVIWENVRKDILEDLSEEKLKGAFILVRGKIELFKDKPQIVIKDKSQLEILESKTSDK